MTPPAPTILHAWEIAFNISRRLPTMWPPAAISTPSKLLAPTNFTPKRYQNSGDGRGGCKVSLLSAISHGDQVETQLYHLYILAKA